MLLLALAKYCAVCYSVPMNPNNLLTDKGTGMKVALLEDDRAIQEMLRLVLQDENYNVIIYQTAEDALKALLDQQDDQGTPPIDLLIVDLRLSRAMSGTEVIQQLRASSKLPSLPIILTTASTFTDREELQRLNVTLVEKPFDVDEMVKVIRELTHPSTLC
jgi:two-component system, chemotaxis family, chemotaxis protein CheY